MKSGVLRTRIFIYKDHACARNRIKKRGDFRRNHLFRAQDETRTHTILRPLPPQSSVYTNFTTCACAQNRTRTCTPRGMRTWNARVYQFRHLGKKKERKTRLELATPTLARSCSTNWAISAKFCLQNFARFLSRLGKIKACFAFALAAPRIPQTSIRCFRYIYCLKTPFRNKQEFLFGIAVQKYYIF